MQLDAVDDYNSGAFRLKVWKFRKAVIHSPDAILTAWITQYGPAVVALKKSKLEARGAMATGFEPGDFVRLKTSPTGRVGVVSRIDAENTAPVQVYWRRDSGRSMTGAYKPDDLRLVPSEDAPEYAATLKRNLF